MNLITARGRLERMLAWDQDPALTIGEVMELLVLAKRHDLNGTDPRATTLDVAWAGSTNWAASTAYTAGDVVRQDGTVKRWWIADISGTSHTSAPTWPDLTGYGPTGVSIWDGSEIRWVDLGGEWNPTWNLDAAASEGWRWKAAKASPRYGFTTDGQRFDRSDLIAHCLQMATTYGKRINGSARTPTC